MKYLCGISLGAMYCVAVISKVTYIRLAGRNKSEQRHELPYKLRSVVAIEEIVSACMMELDFFFPHAVNIDITDRM